MAWAELRNGRYRGMYRSPDGKKHSAGWSTSKRAAKRLAEEEEAKIRHGLWADPTAGEITFSDYFEKHWMPNQVLAANSISGYWSKYNSELKAAFGHVKIKEITPAMVQRWLISMQQRGVGENTANQKLTLLSTVLGAQKGVSAVRDGLIATNPCTKVTRLVAPPHEKDLYTVEEADLLLAAMDPWWHPLVLTAVETGARWGEIIALTPADRVDQQLIIRKSIVHVAKKYAADGRAFQEKEYPKSRKPRTIGVSQEFDAFLGEVVKARELFPTDRIFAMPGPPANLRKSPKAVEEWLAGGDVAIMRTDAWPHGVPVSGFYFRKNVWMPAHEKAKVRRRRFHDLRGSHLSWLLAGGADLQTVKERAGHSSLATTELYLKALPDADKRALEALENTRRRSRGVS